MKKNVQDLVGVGLRQPHYSYILENKPDIGWFEIHSENFFQKGGPALHFLDKIREDYPLSLHGVGLSLGSAEGLDQNHLDKLKHCAHRFSPFLISEHLSWSRINGVSFPDLLPLPYTDETLVILERNIDQVQTILGREILIENPSSYLEYKESHYAEQEFLTTLCQKTGSKILLDINNIYVSCTNHGWNPVDYLDSIPLDLIGEIHLAGHSRKTFSDGSTLLIDDHGSAVPDAVWDLFNYLIDKGLSVPTLIEWDTDIPSFDVLQKEASKVLAFLSQRKSIYASA